MSTTSATMKLIEPDVNDKVEDTITALAANFALIDALYPVGTIYQSTKNTNPSTFIGGTWTALTGRMLIGAGADYPAGTTGGEATHTLATAEMPAHSHKPHMYTYIVSNGANSGAYAIPGGSNGNCSTVSADEDQDRFTESAGGGAAHNNMPPYKAVYMWERTA